MQRYHSANCTGAVNNNTIGRVSVRDTVRANFPISSRRPPPLTLYKLKCNKEPLNPQLGPPDFHPQTPNCPGETLTREYVQSRYRETVEGLESLRKYPRAINESRALKLKAGQVYGVPLSGSLLTKLGVFPEQRAYGEDFKKKWIEVRPISASISSGTTYKNQFSCTELWIQQPAVDQPNTAIDGPGHDDVAPLVTQDDHPHNDSPSAHGGGSTSQ